MKVVVFEAGEREKEGLSALARSHDVTFVGTPLTAANAATFAAAEAVSVFIYSQIDGAVLDAMPRLRLAVTRSTGYDHIDGDACAARGVGVCNVPDYGANTVAEHVFALLLAISHRLIDAADRAARGRISLDGLVGFDLAGRTLGVIGTGNIGRHVCRIGIGFGMNVIAHDPRPDPELESDRVRYAGLDELFAGSDVLSLHVPATPATHNLLSREAFSKMKDGIVIINTARGSLIDSRALIAALISGKVAAAGLDVLPDEPLMRDEADMIAGSAVDGHHLSELLADHVLLRMPNVVVTPHTAYLTEEAIARIIATSADNIAAFAAGTPRNLVSGGASAVSS